MQKSKQTKLGYKYRRGIIVMSSYIMYSVLCIGAVKGSRLQRILATKMSREFGYQMTNSVLVILHAYLTELFLSSCGFCPQ